MTAPHEQMLRQLKDRGLLTEQGAITDAGHEYVRALTRDCDEHFKHSDGKKDQYLKRSRRGKAR